MSCSACGADFQYDTEGCFIIVTEIDYNVAMDDKRFCSFRCLKDWFDL